MPVTEIQLEFEIDSIGPELAARTPSWNVAPTQPIAMVVDRPSPEVRRELHAARWGLIPPWTTTLAKAPALINARVETLTTKKSFSEALAHRRCIIPADGYYEWKTTDRGKVPYYISSPRPIGFAGLYGWWKSPEGEWIVSAAIVTMAARTPLDTIHNRTPVILERDEYTTWLDPAQHSGEAAQSLIMRPNRELTFHPVSNVVGNPRNDTPQLIEAVSSSSDLASSGQNEAVEERGN